MHLTITPTRGLNDQEVQIRLDGAPPGATVRLRSRLVDDFGRCWEAHADFCADETGGVNVSTQAPLDGTYQGIDPMGLYWSMLPADSPPVGGAIKNSLNPSTLEIEACADTTTANGSTERLFIGDGVVRIPVRDGNLRGALFLPSGDGPFPGILVFSGSGGGAEEGRAALLASHGFAALALAYFFADDLPAALIDIPLEYFRGGLDWMAARPEVRGRLAVTGQSRGGELVLLLGSRFRDIGAVVSYVPSHVVWGGFGPETDDQATEPAAWTWEQRPLPAVPRAGEGEVSLDLAEGDPIPLTPYFLKALENREGVESAAIPVERIDAPVLLISGGADAMWPSALMAGQAMRRLEGRGHAYSHIHLTYPHAGHSIRPPYGPTTVTTMLHPVSGDLFALGGTAAGNAAANKDSWEHVLAFLGEHLAL